MFNFSLLPKLCWLFYWPIQCCILFLKICIWSAVINCIELFCFRFKYIFWIIASEKYRLSLKGLISFQKSFINLLIKQQLPQVVTLGLYKHNTFLFKLNALMHRYLAFGINKKYRETEDLFTNWKMLEKLAYDWICCLRWMIWMFVCVQNWLWLKLKPESALVLMLAFYAFLYLHVYAKNTLLTYNKK